MHLSEDGFYSLIHNKYPKAASRFSAPEMDWQALWQEFIAEARRFDGKKLIGLFGDDEPIHGIPDTKNKLTLRDRLLIGEFLRRHHARLAHEIALNGVPGVAGQTILLPEFNKDKLDLIGFIARSHNMDLRSAVEIEGQSRFNF